MKCPIDDRELVMSERHGIEVDYCPSCRGVWLDRGELDKIVAQASAELPVGLAARVEPSKVGRKKKGSFLSELFEF
jgi:Zn-finger nucleic acid-binding protein